MKPADAPQRPDPDALLAHAKQADAGRLRVYLGMSPGVGKTYEMLEAAQRRRAEGGEVLVGLVETHGRVETEALLEGLEVLPRAVIDHRGRTLMEFDLDTALARRPKLILVDEYAHSNAPGSRHPKRWQDVDELLAAGIDVWTTLNVQHLESLVDIVWRITGVRQRETVPDQALRGADQIHLVDVTPQELRARLEAGKVYVPETARLAGDRFFKLENLTALRELALRRAAQTVDDQLNAVMKRQGIEGPWAAGERVLVLIAGDAMAPTLVRAGRRLADAMMDAPWTVATVELSNRAPPPPFSARRTMEALKLAEQLGGSTLVLTGDDLPGAVLEYAKRNNVTQIVLGKSRPIRWRRLFGRDLAQALLDRSGGAALHFVTEGAPGEQPKTLPAPHGRRMPWREWAIAGGAVGAATAVSAVLDRISQSANLAMIYLAAVLVAGLMSGLRPALAAAAFSIVLYNFFFLDPRLSFVIGRPADLLTFAIFLAAAAATGWLSGRVRDQARLATRRASAVSALLAASRRLSGASERGEAARALAEQAAAACGGRAIVLLPHAGEIVPKAGSPELVALSTAEMAAARWAWERGEAAGAGTGTLPQIGWTFRPLEGLRATAGVVGYEVPAGERGPENERLLIALLDQGAVALERAELAASHARVEATRRSDQLRAALLNSISHDLRTPLATVMGSASTLIELGPQLPADTRADLLVSIREEAERLNGYVGNLLDMTRLEGDALRPQNALVDIREVLDAALARIGRRIGQRPLTRDWPADLPLVRLDPSLLEQAVVNILENAVAYSPADTPLEVAAYEDRANIVISIEDEGKGIPTEDLERVFDRFRRIEEPSDRSRGDRTKGVGLGLSISKGFVEAMGGRIAAASPIHTDPAGGMRGTRILISLPKIPPAAAAEPA